MEQLKRPAVLLLLSICSIFLSLTACTPEFTQRQGEALAGQARLLDSIDVERQNQRLLSRQTQVCLLSANGGEEAGAELLRTMQAGFSGYFFAVGVVGESIDYLRAISSATCPGSSYLFYVQPAEASACVSGQPCAASNKLIITVISAGDRSLVDRIKFSIKSSWLAMGGNEAERRQKAFEQLAIVLTGGQ